MEVKNEEWRYRWGMRMLLVGKWTKMLNRKDDDCHKLFDTDLE